MSTVHLNEHDANQGAQSSGEFLGMTGNSGWYLLGSGGATILMVIFLWGILGVSLLLCLLVGLILCLLSVAYVFTLKNNRPDHYDTDFFESVLVEAGVVDFSFGPRGRFPSNPFTASTIELVVASEKRTPTRAKSDHSRGHQGSVESRQAGARSANEQPYRTHAKAEKSDANPVVTRVAHDQLQEKLTLTEELLEDALAETGEL